MTTPETWDDLSELTRGFMASKVIITAAELEVFDHLADDGATAEEVAGHYGSTQRAFAVFLNALAALGVIEKHDDRYRNTPLGRRHLITTSPHYLGDGVKLRVNLWERWSKLESILRGEAGEMPSIMEDPEQNRRFIRAMHAYHFDEAREMAPLLELERATTLLDLGGGAASFAIAFCLASPKLKAVMVDRAVTLETAREYVAEHDLTDRIELRAGDFYDDAAFEFGGPYDLVFISQVLHIEDEERNRALLDRVARATSPAGRIVINEVAIEESGTEPLWGALFAVSMLVATDRGSTYPQQTIASWLQAAGCTRVDFLTEALTIGHKDA